MNKVKLQMWDVFEKFFWMPDSDVVEKYEMLVNLPHAANMWNDRNIELLSQQANCNEFADAAQPCATWLQKSHAISL